MQSSSGSTHTLESMPRELENCPEDMLKPTSNAALRSLSACSCSCNLATYEVICIQSTQTQCRKTTLLVLFHCTGWLSKQTKAEEDHKKIQGLERRWSQCSSRILETCNKVYHQHESGTKDS